MRFRTMLVVLTSVWLFASTASALQLRLVDRPLANPLATRVPAQLLAGSGSDGPKTNVAAIALQSASSLVINGGSLIVPFLILARLTGDVGVYRSDMWTGVGILAGASVVTSFVSVLAIYGIAKAFGKKPSYGWVVMWSIISRLAPLLVVLPVAGFMHPGSGLALVTVVSSLGTLAGGIMDVVQSQREFEEPVYATRPPMAMNEPGLRSMNVPLVSLRF